VSACSPKHQELTISGMRIPASDEPQSGQSARARLNNMVVELHRLYCLPAALSLLSRESHHLCGSQLANHEILGTDILGVWPILPKLKGGKQQIGLLATEESLTQLDQIIQDISLVKTDLAFEVNVLILGNSASITDLVDNPMIASVGFMERSLAMPVLEQHNGYLGLPAFELLAQQTLRDVLGYMINMDIVIDLCGPSAASIMTNLKAHGIHTSTCINNVQVQDSNEQSIDPVAIQAYSGAYKSLIVPSPKDAQKLISYGVTPSAMVSSTSALLNRIFDQIIKEASDDSNDNTSLDDSETVRSLAA